MYDTHVHSTFSPDGQSSVEEYSKLVDKGIVKGLGFAEHLDFLPECGAYGFLDYDLYSSTINKYKEKGYEFYLGAEVDYANRVEGEIIEKLKKQHYDYTICSVHMIQGFSVSDKKGLENFYDANTFKYILGNYYDEVNLSLHVEQIDVIGHIGIYKRHLDSSFISNHVHKDLIKELDLNLAKECARSGKIIEVNSSGLFAKMGSTIPNAEFLKTYYENGGSTISIGSDAHDASDAARGFEQLKQILREIGFKYTVLPWNREKEYKLD
jgi:histidinol-phosphatase (PHP family)